MRPYQQCSHCILDTKDDHNITFDPKGVCVYCNNYFEKYLKNPLTELDKELILNQYLQKIKQASIGKKYDSIMGLSGGVDSSYLAYKAKEFKLNPLLVHFDNGWNSELAVKNIESIINKTGFDLYTYVVDWEEFKDLQLAYIKASVLDWEIPSDHGFYALLFNQAYKYNIRYILTGHNHQTEAILPKTMRWSKLDVANIIDIYKKYGTGKLKTFPMLGFYKNFYFGMVKKLERVNLLEYIPYNKDDAKELIKKEFGWRDYGGKHYESIFTRFYQGYVLTEKFGYDKRKAHLSNLICSGQITREKALEELEKPAYNSEQLAEDTTYVIKKLGLTAEEFEKYMKMPIRSHLEFKSYEMGIYRQHEKFMELIKPLSNLLKKVVKM